MFIHINIVTKTDITVTTDVNSPGFGKEWNFNPFASTITVLAIGVSVAESLGL